MAFTVGNQRDIFSKLKNMAPAKRLDMFKSAQSQAGASPFSFLTPAEFAELFPKYYMQKLPEVSGFYKALSNKQDSEGKTYGPHGEAGSAAVGTNEKVTNTVRAKEIYDYLRLKGVDHTHAVGIVNNMKYESNFNSGAIGDHGTSGGLFQHHASRFSAMKEYVGDGWQTNWRKQIDFALTEGEMKTYLGRNYANPADASVGFTTHFEKPANTDATATYRSGTANGYASAMEGKGGEPSGGQTAGGNYEITSSGFVVPRNKNLFDQGNEEQCATLAKGFNPDIGRSHSWTVVPGQIKPGMTVATMRYNLEGNDREKSGYHTGIAMTAPDDKGNFLLLEQYKGRKPQVREVNAKAFPGGSIGGTTEFGIIQSNGRLHDEQSTEALSFGASVANEDQRKMIQDNIKAVTSGNTAGAEQGSGNVSINQNPDTPAGTPGPQTNLQQQEAVKSIQTASIGDVFRFAGAMAGFFSGGEGIGDGVDTSLQFAEGPAASFQKNSSVLIRRLMKDYNLTNIQAAGIVGNLASESNVKGQPLTAGGKERGGLGLGWGQWTASRRKEFERFAAKYGKENNINDPITNSEVNYQFLKKEFDSTHKHVIENVRNAKTLEQATYQGLNFERPGWSLDTTVTKDKRGRKHTHSTFKSFDEVANMASDKGGLWKDRLKFAGAAAGHYDIAEKESQATTKVATQKTEPLAAPPPAAVAQKAPEPASAAQQTATVSAKPKTFMERLKEFNPYREPSVAGSAGAKVEPASQTQAAPAPVPAKPTPANKPTDMPPGVYNNPDVNMLDPTPLNRQKPKDKQSFEMNLLPNQPQKQVSIDGGMHMIDRQYSSPSLERAMKNLTNTSGASDGHFGGNNLA